MGCGASTALGAAGRLEVVPQEHHDAPAPAPAGAKDLCSAEQLLPDEDQAAETSGMSPQQYIAALEQGVGADNPHAVLQPHSLQGLYGCICVGYSPADFEWVGGAGSSSRSFVFGVGPDGLAQFAQQQPLQILMMAGLDCMSIYNDLVAGCCFSLVVWNPAGATAGSADGNIKSVDGNIKSAGWDAVAQMLQADYRNLWDTIISHHWFQVCTTSFTELAAEYDENRDRDAMQSFATRHHYSTSSQNIMTASRLEALGAAARASDVRAFLYHEYDLGAMFTGSGTVQSSIFDMPEFETMKPIKLFVLDNIKSAGLASCPLCIRVEEVVHFVVDALRWLCTTLDLVTAADHQGPSLPASQSTKKLKKSSTSQALMSADFPKSSGTLPKRTLRLRAESQHVLNASSVKVLGLPETEAKAAYLGGYLSWKKVQNILPMLLLNYSSTVTKSLTPDEYLSRFQAGEMLRDNEKVNGLFGRVVSGNSPAQFQWLTSRAPTDDCGGMGRTVFVLGPDGLRRLLSISAAHKIDGAKGGSLVMRVLIDIGLEPLHIYEKLSAGHTFELVVFSVNVGVDRTGELQSSTRRRRWSIHGGADEVSVRSDPVIAPHLADWSGVCTIVQLCYPSVGEIVAQHLPSLKDQSYDRLQKEYKLSLYEARAIGPLSPAYMTAERLAALGDGYTADTAGHRGLQEFLYGCPLIATPLSCGATFFPSFFQMGNVCTIEINGRCKNLRRSDPRITLRHCALGGDTLKECFQYVCQEFRRVRQLCDSRVARTWRTLGVTSSLSGERSKAFATKETNSQLKAALESFQHSASDKMTFPTTLTAAQRRFVHQQATRLGLKSRSSGSDGGHHISTSLDLGRQVTVYKLDYESD